MKRAKVESNVSKIYRKIYGSLKAQIESGALKPGAKLPSTRTLAATLNISRHTVRRSYEELCSQGYIKLAKGLRPIVLNSLTDIIIRPQIPADTIPINFNISTFGQNIINSAGLSFTAVETLNEFNAGGAALQELPINTWRKMLQKANSQSDYNLQNYQYNPFGSISLRESLVNYLSRSRGIQTVIDNIAIFNNTECGTDLLCRLIINPNDNVIVENPGTPGARMMFQLHRANLIPLKINQQKIHLTELADLPVKLIYLTPSHHDPLGTVMSLSDRINLINWANEHNAFIIEDDYDCEYHYTLPIQPSLKSLDNYDCIVYRYNFWRTLFPLTKLGFIVLPNRLISLLKKAKTFVERDTTLIDQEALAYFIDEGHFERHIKRTRSVYAKRRTLTIQTLMKSLKQLVKVYDGGGIQLILTFSTIFSSAEILTAAKICHLPLISTNDYYLDNPVPNEFILFYAHMPEYKIIETLKNFTLTLNRK